MRRVRKLTKMLIISLAVIFVLGGNVMAATFNFSFVTGSSSIGGVGYKNAASRGGVVIQTYDANVNSNRCITVWGATNTGRTITGTDIIQNAWVGSYLAYTDKGFEGNIYLWGNPSVVGASAHGEFIP